ncbi:hypothetical protein GPECTOR_1g583 [Gonium pectorale]|uniref:C2 domain-containing protein n=1 Tax=Gonium pectorale TaxID=33097 RepID=A0A150H392_GONPE|nr:hypothetical protein GPECTOR_1g583 [Gonium pectorale]|eukprot:KXZ56647.1 hypothetical protein GPECTOR_1g583 [Gonium pectorale]
MGILYEKKDGHWVEYGRTEMIANARDPKFVKTFKYLYNFERVQHMKVLMVDLDKGQDPKTIDPDCCNFLGLCEFTISEVVTAAGRTLRKPLTKKEGKPSTKSLLVMLAEEVSNCKDLYRFQLGASNLRNVERVGRSDPFLQISRMKEDGITWLPVYKTAVRKNNLNPVWDEITVRATQLNNGDLMCPLKLEVFDYERNGSHRLLGQVTTNTERMLEMGSQHGSVLPLQGAPGKPTGGEYGTLQVKRFVAQPQPSFLDYLAGGTEIGFIVAVDFTGSNGDPRDPGSKHYFAGKHGGPTQYEQAVMGIGGVLEYYDHDKVFPCFGFGGQYDRNPTDHCFPMGAPPDSACHGIAGVLQAYRTALSTWKLSGPTLFAPVIRMASNVARATVGSMPPKYTVLLILTDGAIMDMPDTINAIIDASTLPLSILIVGIGRDDFGNMHVLDSDKKRLSSGNRTAARDIVQFVELTKFAGDGALLAKELLAELPGQLLEYMRVNNIQCPPSLVAAPTMMLPAAPPAPTMMSP